MLKKEEEEEEEEEEEKGKDHVAKELLYLLAYFTLYVSFFTYNTLEVL